MIHYSYKFRLYPNSDQRIRLAKQFGTCRFVWNYFLDRRNKLYRETKKGSTYNQDCAELTKLKCQYNWMRECDSQALQQVLKNLDTAFTRFFKNKSEYPKFKSKHGKQSFRNPHGSRINITDRLMVSKFREGIKLIQDDRPIKGKFKFVTVSKNKSGQYFASITVERKVKPLPASERQVGIDVGIKTFVTCSDGKTFKNIKPYRTLEKRLIKFQRLLSRKKKGSSNRNKAKLKLAKLHQKVVNIRSDYLHQITRKIVNENQVIAIEDLNVKGMMRNRKLAKSISDVSLYEFARQLEYKCNWYGRTLIKVDRFYPSSKTCNKCGFINQELTLSQRHWTCSNCKAKLDRDANASQNILAEGLRTKTVGTTGLACGENVRPTKAGNSQRSRKSVSKKRLRDSSNLPKIGEQK